HLIPEPRPQQHGRSTRRHRRELSRQGHLEPSPLLFFPDDGPASASATGRGRGRRRTSRPTANADTTVSAPVPPPRDRRGLDVSRQQRHPEEGRQVHGAELQ
ncbi:unnamed protein product, partial [Laminaria digitata]